MFGDHMAKNCHVFLDEQAQSAERRLCRDLGDAARTLLEVPTACADEPLARDGVSALLLCTENQA